MSERNEVVVTYADLSESSDNEAIGGLLDEHAIAEGEKAIFFVYSLSVSVHNVFLAGESADKHYKS